MQTFLSFPSSFQLFPIAGYSQVTSQWLDPNQQGYDHPMMDAVIQQRYLKKLR